MFICFETNEVPNMGSLDAVNKKVALPHYVVKNQILGCTLKKCL